MMAAVTTRAKSFQKLMRAVIRIQVLFASMAEWEQLGTADNHSFVAELERLVSICFL
jgi:hypothetical protein